MMQCLLLTKDHVWGRYAVGIAQHIFDETTVFSGTRDTTFPDEAMDIECDIIISFLCPWILPEALLSRAPLALNFHPGSKEYPGIGCYNFALYEEAAEFGCVCHHMASKPDTGRIIDERRFPISPKDSVESLQLKCFAHMISQFLTICEHAQAGDRFESAVIKWKREPFVRRQLEALRRIEPGMSKKEIRRRVRAMTYPGAPGAYFSDRPNENVDSGTVESRRAIAFEK